MIVDKPYSRNSAIKRTIYLGRPNIFSTQDLNRDSAVKADFIDELSKSYSLLRQNIIVAQDTLTVDASGNYTAALRIMRNNASNPAYLLSKGSFITLPATVSLSGSGNLVLGRELWILAFASRVTKSFSDDASLCGVASDSLEFSPQPSCQVEVYSGLEFALSTNMQATISGRPGQEYLGVVAKIYRDSRFTTNATETDAWGIMYDAPDIDSSNYEVNTLENNPNFTPISAGNSTRSILSKLILKIEYLLSFVPFLKAAMSKLNTYPDNYTTVSTSLSNLSTAISNEASARSLGDSVTLSSANSHADFVAATAQSTAISTASSDATTKANAAQSAAESYFEARRVLDRGSIPSTDWTSFVRDTNPHDINISSVPNEARIVLLRVQMTPGADTGIVFFEKGTTGYNRAACYNRATGNTLAYDCWVALDASKTISYVAFGSSDISVVWAMWM